MLEFNSIHVSKSTLGVLATKCVVSDLQATYDLVIIIGPVHNLKSGGPNFICWFVSNEVLFPRIDQWSLWTALDTND